MHTLSFGLTCVLTCGIPFGLVIAAVVMPLAHAQENYPVRPGRLRGLGVSSATRLRALPDTPTIAESGVPGYSRQRVRHARSLRGCTKRPPAHAAVLN